MKIDWKSIRKQLCYQRFDQLTRYNDDSCCQWWRNRGSIELNWQALSAKSNDRKWEQLQRAKDRFSMQLASINYKLAQKHSEKYRTWQYIIPLNPTTGSLFTSFLAWNWSRWSYRVITLNSCYLNRGIMHRIWLPTSHVSHFKVNAAAPVTMIRRSFRPCASTLNN